MGTEVSFPRRALGLSGVILETFDNGTPEEIERASQDDTVCPKYAEWLKQSQTCLKPRGAEHYHAYYIMDHRVSVTANKWGGLYYPLTEWLTSHGIEWEEY